MTHSKTTTKSWVPPFCPNSNCKHHNNSGGPWPYKKMGWYRRFAVPHRIQRFTCKTCHRCFSSQTFSTSYWQKLPELDSQIIMKTIGCMSNRQLAKDLKVAPETINRHIARLGRHCMLFHTQMMENSPPVHEVVVDGFESFEYSQYFPIHHHISVEKGTDFIIYTTDSPLRRKGRMTDFQKTKRTMFEKVLGRPDPKAIEKDMRELLQVTLRNNRKAIVYSDDHPAYRRAIKGLDVEIDHRVTPGSAHRDQNNSLWEINLLDLLIRHCSANHKRETIAWSKRRQASAERLMILLVWRNYIKGRREKVRGSPTPAMERGMMDHPLKIEELLQMRIFRTRCELPPAWSDYYDRKVETRALSCNRKHDLKLAY